MDECRYNRVTAADFTQSFKGMVRHVVLTLTILLVTSNSWVKGLRCYTDVDATKTLSVECGLGTGCVKIYINSEELQMRQHRKYGMTPAARQLPELPPKYQNDPVLMRGCFVLAVPDRCYNAENGLSYCWCSTKDLCNGSYTLSRGRLTLALTLAFAVVVLKKALFWQ